jgi:hypothetical protein
MWKDTVDDLLDVTLEKPHDCEPRSISAPIPCDTFPTCHKIANIVLYRLVRRSMMR